MLISAGIERTSFLPLHYLLASGLVVRLAQQMSSSSGRQGEALTHR